MHPASSKYLLECKVSSLPQESPVVPQWTLWCRSPSNCSSNQWRNGGPACRDSMCWHIATSSWHQCHREQIHQSGDIKHSSGWWFGTFFIFPYIGNNNPNWLVFFRGVETTNLSLLAGSHGQSESPIEGFNRGVSEITQNHRQKSG